MAKDIMNFATGRVWRGETVLIEKPVTYPQAWLRGSEKPTLSVNFSDKTLRELSEDCHLSYISGSLNLPVVKAFLAQYTKEHMTQELSSEWVANGRIIGKKGDVISPLNLLEIIEYSGGGDLQTTKEEINLDALAGGILLIYRCIRVPTAGCENDFLTTLATRARGIFPKSNYLNLVISKNNYPSWDHDSGFRALVAAIDMFLVKFPSHPLSRLRMGTIPSRWRDCSALKGVYEVIERYTLERVTDFVSWCWEAALFTEIEKVWKEDISDFSQPDGYFPYIADFGIVDRSPYSTTVNPALHLFTATLFSCLGDKRGFNSRLIPCPTPLNVVENAFIMAYAFTKEKRRGVNPTNLEEYHEQQENYSSEDAHQEESDAQGIQTLIKPPVTNPFRWASYATETKTRLDGERYFEFRSWVKKQIDKPREGSVGEFLAKLPREP